MLLDFLRRESAQSVEHVDLETTGSRGSLGGEFTRNAERSEQLALVAENYDADPVPLAEVIPPGGTLAPGDEWLPVVLEGDGKAVRGRAGEPRGADELGESGRTGLEGAQHGGRLVEDADPTGVVHALILPSQCLRRKFRRAGVGPR